MPTSGWTSEEIHILHFLKTHSGETSVRNTQIFEFLNVFGFLTIFKCFCFYRFIQRLTPNSC
jgi:hypothetical protein